MEPRRVVPEKWRGGRWSRRRLYGILAWQGCWEQEDAMAHSFDRGCLHSSTATPTEMP